MPSTVTQRLRQIIDRPVVVIAAAHEPAGRGQRVLAGTADKGGEHGVTVPAGHTHPGDLPARSDYSCAFPVSQKRILPQHLRWDHLFGAGGGGHCDAVVRRAPTTADAAAAPALVSAARR